MLSFGQAGELRGAVLVTSFPGPDQLKGALGAQKPSEDDGTVKVQRNACDCASPFAGEPSAAPESALLPPLPASDGFWHPPSSGMGAAPPVPPPPWG